MPLYSQAEIEAKRLQQMSVSIADEQPGISDMLEGQHKLSVIGGVVTDVKKVNDDLYHNRLFRSFEEQVDTILNEESVIKVQHKFTGSPVFDPGFQSDTFSSGFTGNGYKLDKDTAVSEYNFEIDNMIVRGTMSVYELLIQQIRATNGGIFVTSSAKVESSSSLSASDDSGTITFDDPSGTGICPFADGDLIMMQRVNPNATVAKNATSGFVKKLVYEVISVTGNVATVDNTTNTQFDNADYPKKGDDFVRIGNVGGGGSHPANRDGVIYITSDDTNAPFMEIFDSINSYSEWTTATPKVRLGNLAGVTHASVNSGSELSGYGLFTDNVYLIGEIVASGGKIGGWKINSTSIYTGTEDHATYTQANGDITFYSNGTVSSIHARKFYIDTNGNAFFQGDITGSSGTFGGSISVGGKTTYADNNSNGVYIGSEGIALGDDNEFTVTNAGAVTAVSFTATGGAVGGSTIDGSDRLLCGSVGAGQIEIVPTGNINTTWIGVVEGGDGPAQTPWRVLANGNAFFQYDAIQMATGHVLELLNHFPAAGVSGASSHDGGLIFKDMSDQLSETDSTVKKWINVTGDGDGNLLWGYASTGSGSFSTLAFLDASGNWKIDGTVTPSYSDARLKTNLVPMSNSIDKIMQMKPYEFDWVEKRGGEHATGLIAQDMLELMPEIVTKGGDGEHYSIKYQELIPTLINAIQELKQEVEELKND